jgi:hypothetical protein
MILILIIIFLLIIIFVITQNIVITQKIVKKSIYTTGGKKKKKKKKARKKKKKTRGKTKKGKGSSGSSSSPSNGLNPPPLPLDKETKFKNELTQNDDFIYEIYENLDPSKKQEILSKSNNINNFIDNVLHSLTESKLNEYDLYKQWLIDNGYNLLIPLIIETSIINKTTLEKLSLINGMFPKKYPANVMLITQRQAPTTPKNK